jgi:hypothetical protein
LLDFSVVDLISSFKVLFSDSSCFYFSATNFLIAVFFSFMVLAADFLADDFFLFLAAEDLIFLADFLVVGLVSVSFA